MSGDLEIRLLRSFVVVAEELHFSRAAQRLFVAQQALSRDIQRLEERAGTRLFDRTSRQVALTPSGTMLLARARQLLLLHDTTLRELHGELPSLTVDVVGPGLTPALVLAEARRRAPELEFFARFHTGEEPATPLLLAERIDVTFGRDPGLGGLDVRQRAVRNEPIGVLLPEGHELASLEAVPLEALRHARVCIRAGNHATSGWEHAVLQLLAPFGVEAAGSHPHVPGVDELAQHLRERNAPILTMTTQPDVPGAVLRPLVEPVALFPWTMIWRATTHHPGIAVLNAAVDALAAAGDWLPDPGDAWLPHPESSAR
ncbi:LysR family transcriptional regulator [Pseudonocardia sp. TRM90224]|uniref:LysR family transcriptional regulator n=1 Tax=Pseudonocardia sp. TRM90224 TaxID=2812678 RepID=UPI001E43A896|nr:LysR family transcriptional regulator [Pseudonocardia sp. TRM90224]